MYILFFMIGVSLTMAIGFLGAFVWSMRTGQQDDLYTPSLRILTDDVPTEVPTDVATNVGTFVVEPNPPTHPRASVDLTKLSNCL